jgi:hypothetical protein
LGGNGAGVDRGSGGLMITNIPDAEEMKQTALWLFFNAWEQILGIIGLSLAEEFGSRIVKGHIEPSSQFKDEMEELFDEVQPELRLAYVLLQQSHELGLKAKICAVNPFLLFLGSDVRSWAKSNADFSESRTLDAIDLIPVVNAVCSTPLSDRFKSCYETLRGDRNKIYHLGVFKNRLDPIVLLGIMIQQYPELFSGSSYISDRLQNLNLSTTKYSMFYNKRTNELSLLLTEMAQPYKVASKAQFKTLFGFSKQTHRYMCHSCCYEAHIYDNGLSAHEIGTATLNADGSAVFCHVCRKEFDIYRSPCSEPNCKSNVISNNPEHLNHCHVCGAELESLAD